MLKSLVKITHSYNINFKLVGDNLLAKRKNEKFKRIKCSTLAKMLQENNTEESIYNLNRDEGNQSIVS